MSEGCVQKIMGEVSCGSGSYCCVCNSYLHLFTTAKKIDIT